MFGRGNRHKRQVVRDVFAVGVLPARYKVLEERISRKTLGRIFIAAFVEIVEFDPYAVHKFLREFAGHAALARF